VLRRERSREVSGPTWSEHHCVGHTQDRVSPEIRLVLLVDEDVRSACWVLPLARAGLGLEDFRGMECTSTDKCLITYMEEGDIVALEAKPGVDVSVHRKKAGL
jgi:hypothetical protein